MNKFRLILVGAVLAIAGLGALYASLFGEATVHVVVAAGRSIELSANGQVLVPEASSGDHRRFKLKQGDYTFSVKDTEQGSARTYALKLDSGFDDYVLPLDERQCFTRLDVTKTMYAHKGDARPAAPRIVERIPAQRPFEKKSSDYLDEGEMPKSIKKSRSVMLLAEVDCAALTLPDGALLSEVGF